MTTPYYDDDIFDNKEDISKNAPKIINICCVTFTLNTNRK